MSRVNSVIRQIKNKNMRRKLYTNDSFSLISSNCNGAFILHDLGLPFNSPFVNLWIEPKDFIKLVKDLKEYMSAPLSFIDEEDKDYPVGRIKDVRIYFMHYKDKDEAEEKWEKRKKRINYNNIFVMFSDRDGCTYEDLLAYDKLPIKNKVVFTNRLYPDIKSSFYIHGFENQDSVGHLFQYMPGRLGKKYYDQFNYVDWFNKNTN